MTVALPNLDDRRWADLVQESRALIPVYGGEWTDHNVHDPGITLIELLSYVAEMDVFQLNQIPDTHKRKFLSLIGVHSAPPRAAQAVLRFGLDAATPSLDLPAGLAFVTATANAIRFQLRDPITVLPGELVALQTSDGSVFQDLTPEWRREQPVAILGSDPRPGAALYLGFSSALPAGRQVNLYFSFAGDRSSHHERHRIEKEVADRVLDCSPPASANSCAPNKPAPTVPPATEPASPLLHPSVRTTWEFWSDNGAQGKWLPLRLVEDHLRDDTRSLTLNGYVSFQLPTPMLGQVFGTVTQKLFYLRCRFESGMYDVAPSLLGAFFNAASAAQMTPFITSLQIAPGAQIQGPIPNAGDQIQMQLQLDAEGRIRQLVFGGGAASDPRFRVLAYRPPTSDAGLLQIEAAFLGRSSGFPFDQFSLPNFPVLTRDFRLFSLSGSSWQEWQWRSDLESSSHRSAEFALSPASGKVQFGDGKNGLLPEPHSLLFVLASSTEVGAGNVPPHSLGVLENSPHNRALLGSKWPAVSAHLQLVDNPFAAEGGADAETPDQASLRAIQLVNSPTRAVSISDYEHFTLTTPGIRMARAMAVADFHDHFPCFKAPGIVTVVVVPFLPIGKPSPSRASRSAIASHLNRRRIIGTRIRVVAPQYVGVSLQARVRALKGLDSKALQTRILARLRQFLDPLVGGESGNGWPFGRHVYAPDLLAVIADVPGVDHVLEFAFTGGCTPPCNEICIPRTGLAYAETLAVEVIS